MDEGYVSYGDGYYSRRQDAQERCWQARSNVRADATRSRATRLLATLRTLPQDELRRRMAMRRQIGRLLRLAAHANDTGDDIHRDQLTEDALKLMAEDNTEEENNDL